MRRVAVHPSDRFGRPAPRDSGAHRRDAVRVFADAAADEEQVAPGATGEEGAPREVAEARERAHLEVVGEGHASKSQAAAQQPPPDLPGKRGRDAVRPCGVRDHDGAGARECAPEGLQIPRAFLRVLRHPRQRDVRVERGSAEPWKVLQTAADAARMEPAEELARGSRDRRRVFPGAAVPEDLRRRAFDPAIDDRREIHAESEPTAGLAGELAGAPRQAARGRVAERDRRTEEISQPIHGTALLIEKDEQTPPREVGHEPRRLLRGLDVAAEENDPARRVAIEDLPLGSRQLGPRDPDAEEPRDHSGPLRRSWSEASSDSAATGVS